MIPRRRMLEIFAGGAAGYSLCGAPKAASLPPTPPQTAGPFYPRSFPADADNDWVQITGRAGIATGTITYITGRVLDEADRGVSGARVEIWQCDANGRYHYVDDGRSDYPLDENFQGYGETVTDERGIGPQALSIVTRNAKSAQILNAAGTVIWRYVVESADKPLNTDATLTHLRQLVRKGS